MFSRNFLKGVLWGSFAASVGLAFVLAHDEKKRKKFIKKGTQLKDTAIDFVSEVIKEGKEELKDLEKEMEDVLPAFKNSLLARMNDLEDKIKQLGDMVQQ